MSGGAAGVACWTSSYGIDVIKTKIQAEILNKKLTFVPNGSFLKNFTAVYRENGIKGYF